MTVVTNFTIEQIKAAHAKVKSGADFPKFTQEINQLGVTFYETYVNDGHTDYYGNDSHRASATAKYAPLAIAIIVDAETFNADLKAHQQGKTDYLTFCNDCAKSGIEKWVVRLDEMTCTYYDKSSNIILVEKVPN